jgi:hypothetical protein
MIGRQAFERVTTRQALVEPETREGLGVVGIRIA